MDAAALDSLLSSTGRAALAVAALLAPTPATALGCLSQLRKQFLASLAADVLEQTLLRAKAETKFARAERMLFTRESLEMASSEAVARHRAARFAPYPRVLDLGCGIGGDTLALAGVGCRVEAVESDPVRRRMAEWNLVANGLSADFHPLDVLADALPDADAAFADPGRRAQGQRYLSLKDYLPPPAAIVARFRAGFPLAFKLAPGVALEELAGFDGEIEFIMLDGELKECALWLGPLGTPGRRATLLGSAGESVTMFAEKPDEPADAEPIRAFLYDPAAAVVRAGLVPNLGAMLDATPADATVQMLSADEPMPTPFATAYRVDAVLPFDPRKVQAWLKSHGIGRVTVVKRGALSDAAAVADKWKLNGGEHRFVIVTRQLGEQVAVIGERLEP